MGGEPLTLEGLARKLDQFSSVIRELSVFVPRKGYLKLSSECRAVLSSVSSASTGTANARTANPSNSLSIPTKAPNADISLANSFACPSYFDSDSPASPDVNPPPCSPPPAPTNSYSAKRGHASDSDGPESVEMSVDGFTTVTKKRSRKQQNKTDFVVSDETIVPPRPAKVARPVPTASASDSPPEGRRVKLPPPLYLRNKANWGLFTAKCKERNISISGSNTTHGIRVTTENNDSFRVAVDILTVERMPYHTHTLEENRKLRVVIRGVPKEFSEQEIRNDLINQNFPVHSVHRMYTRDRRPLDMVTAALDLSPEGKAICKEQFTILKMSGLTVEAPHRRGGPMQCHRCQLYGHSQTNCFAAFACVKCLGNHQTRDCTRNKETDGPPSCVLCRQPGHPANYRGCPRAPRTRKFNSAPKRAFRPAPLPTVPAWRNRDFPPLPTAAPSVYIPPPQRNPKPVDIHPTGNPDDRNEIIRAMQETKFMSDLRAAITVEERGKLLRENSDIVNRILNRAKSFSAIPDNNNSSN